MQEHHLELSVGDVVQIGEFLLTLVDIDGADVSFRLDPQNAEEPVAALQEAQSPPPAK